MNYGIIGVHHVGYFVKDIEKAIETFLKMGYEDCGPTVQDPVRHIKLRFCKMQGELIELVESDGEDSPVANMDKNDKTGHPYHICYIVDDIEKSVEEIRKDRFALPASSLEKSQIDGKRVIHFFNKQIGIFELIEK